MTIDLDRLEHTCPNCGHDLQDKGCKLVCEKCGYFASCAEF